MYVLIIFRFLALTVRSSSLRSCGTPQSKTAASGSFFLKTTLWVNYRQGRAGRVLFTLDDSPGKTGLAVVVGARSDALHLPDRRGFWPGF